jgi:NACalpha-BTF3-like transcription factor
MWPSADMMWLIRCFNYVIFHVSLSLVFVFDINKPYTGFHIVIINHHMKQFVETKSKQNMIVVLYKKKEEYWNTPFLSVEPAEYKSSFPSSSSSSQQKGEQKKKKKEKKTTTITTTTGVVEDDDMKLEASLRSIEKAAASKSLEAKAQIPRVTLPPSSSSSKVIQSSSKGTNDVVAPTTFQNTIMFELD